ncbi:MAG: N-acetyltransferase [Acholeplasmatales bacterium]|nr:N-acetyltransferase [Acholeplasmatales bacterium]
MIEIRNVVKEDSNRILDIYRYYIINTAITFEEKVPTIEEFRNRIISISNKYPYICILEDGVIKGYAYSHEYYGRDAYKYSNEISIYIDKDSKGKGLGKMLYLELENRLKNMGITNLYSCIAHTDIEDEYLNNDSELFHNKLGFKRVGLFTKCGYKFNKWYDVIWMEKIINEHN